MLPSKVLLIISGSIAAYKSLDLIRRLRERGVEVQCILTKGGAEFVTPLSVTSLAGTPVYTELFSLKDETEMGHIRLSRESADIAQDANWVLALWNQAAEEGSTSPETPLDVKILKNRDGQSGKTLSLTFNRPVLKIS